jgi:hypothetical protein
MVSGFWFLVSGFWLKASFGLEASFQGEKDGSVES